jgi:glycerophosphoryl diester phosphodiesterase
MVFHDKSCKRLFKKNIKINELTCHELQRELPSIPTLETVVNRYGTKTHLMVEIKKEDYPQPAKQSAILKEIFSKLTPIKDYHFITLHPEMFLFMTFVPSNTFLPIAITSYRRSSQLSLHKKYGGVLGHYQFLSKQRIKKHRLHGHKVGVGYVSSKNSLFREINRGVEWLFSNHALKMQEMLNKLIQEKRK